MFRHVAGLREHAALVVGGQRVGRVEAISPVPHGAGGALAGDVGVAVTVAIATDDVSKVPADAQIFVASRGPLSDKYLEVAPPHGAPGPAVLDGQELRGADPPTLDNILQHTWTNMTTFQAFVRAVEPELTALRGRLAELRGRLAALSSSGPPSGAPASTPDDAIGETRALVASARRTYDGPLGGNAGLARLRAVLGDARATIAELRTTIDALSPKTSALAAQLTRVRGRLAGSALTRTEQTLATIRAAIDKVDPLLAALDEVGGRIADGEGSVGRLMRDPEFPEDAKDLGKIMKRQFWKILERPPD
jgi:ABC-type transporter Mla subunit MlaD